jgi:hypothetical protein
MAWDVLYLEAPGLVEHVGRLLSERHGYALLGTVAADGVAAAASGGASDHADRGVPGRSTPFSQVG